MDFTTGLNFTNEGGFTSKVFWENTPSEIIVVDVNEFHFLYLLLTWSSVLYVNMLLSDHLIGLDPRRDKEEVPDWRPHPV